MHWALLLAICVPLRLDTGLAWLVSNVSLPFFAPFITFAELEVGARVVRGHWMVVAPKDVHALNLRALLTELVVGTAILAALASSVGAACAWALGTVFRRRSDR